MALDRQRRVNVVGNITNYEDKLLSREKYYKRIKREGLWLTIFFIALFAAQFINEKMGPPSITVLLLMVISILTVWESRLRMKHIESIKHYRARENAV